MFEDSPFYAYIPVKDLARAKRFYEDKVGLAPGNEEQGGITYTFAGGTACFMYVSPGAGSNQASTAFWKVTDIVGKVAALEKRGVTFERYDMPDVQWKGSVARVGDVLNAWFKDSEGNIMALIESPA